MSRTDRCILAFCIVSLMALIAGTAAFVRYDEKSAIRNAGRPMCFEFNPPIMPLNLPQLRAEFAWRSSGFTGCRWIDNYRIWRVLEWLIERDERLFPRREGPVVITGGIM